MDKNLRLLRVAEVAEMTRLKPKTIRMYCSKRSIPFIKLNGAVLFDFDEILDWIKRSKVTSIKRKGRKKLEVEDEI